MSAAELKAIQVELARRGFLDFARLVAPSSFVFGAAHCAIGDFVERWIAGSGFTKGQVALAPRAGKSMLTSIFLPAYLIGRFPSRKIIHLCNNLDLTRQFSEQLVALLQSEDYRAVFPHVELIDVSSGRINFKDRRQPKGEWGRYFITSIKKATSGHGAHFLLVDDPLTEQEATSKLIKDSIWARWSGGFTTRVDPVFNRMLIVGTRWARDDLQGRCIAQTYESDSDDPWQVLKIPVIVDQEQAERINAIALRDPIFVADQKDGKVKLLNGGGTFAPERFGIDFVEKKRADLPPEQFAALYLQSPTPEQGTVFRRHMFRPLGRDSMRSMREVIAYEMMSCDLAMKAEERSDFSAMLRLGVSPITTVRAGTEYIQNSIAILDAYVDRIQPADISKRIRQFWREWECPRSILVEDAASGSMVIQNLRRVGLPVMGFNPRKLPRGKNGKEERAHLAALLIANTPIFYDESNAAVQAVIQQLLEFPRSDHDDACFAGETQLVTSEGLKRIDDVQVGDLVLTHKGRFRRVLARMKRQVDGVHRLKAKGLDEVRVTGNHPMLTMDVRAPACATDAASRRAGRHLEMTSKGVSWRRVDEIVPRPSGTFTRKGKAIRQPRRVDHTALTLPIIEGGNTTVRLSDFDPTLIVRDGIAFPRDERFSAGHHGRAFGVNNEIDLTRNFGWLMGLFAAEGCIARGQMLWACDREAIDAVEALTCLAFGRTPSIGAGTNCFKATFGAKAAVGLFSTIWARSEGIRIPPWVFEANIEFRRGFIEGVMHGDCHNDKVRRRSRLEVSSRHFCWGVKLLLASIGQRSSGVTQTKEAGSVAVFRGQTIHTSYDCWQVSWASDGGGVGVEDKAASILGYWVERNMFELGKTDVYNLEVEEDHSYVTTGGIAHNCDALVQAILYLRGRNEFDSSFDVWADEINLLREESDPEDPDEAQERERAEAWLRTPIERRPGRSVYLMTPAERHRHAREQARKNRPKAVRPYTSERFDLDE